MKKTAVIAGSTGLIGSHCLSALLSSGRYGCVRSIVRRPSGVRHPLLDERIIDFESLNASSIGSADDAFCCLGTTMKQAGSKENFQRVDFHYVTAFARACREAGVDQFIVVSSIGARAGSSSFYLDVKGRMEDELCRIGFRSLHIFRPSLLLGDRKERRAGESAAAILAKPFSFLMIGPLRPYRPIAGGDVARAMAAVACEESDGVHIHYYPDIIRLSARFNQ